MAYKNVLKIVEDLDKLLAGLEDKTIEQIATALDKAYTALEQRLLKLYPQYLANKDTFPQIRAKLLIEEVKLLLDLVKPSMSEYYTSRLESLISQTHGLGTTFAATVASTISGIDYATQGLRINIEAVRFAAENAFDRLKSHSDAFRQRIVTNISYNLALGTGVRRVASQLQAELGILKSRAEAIARTETIAALSDATEYFYQNNEIDYVQIFSTADDRTCRFCRARNMHVYKLGDIRVPIHVRCRCYLAPFTWDWYDEGLFDQEWSKNYYRELVNGSAVPLDYGVAPFERSAGLSSPPQAVWSPTRGRV